MKREVGVLLSYQKKKKNQKTQNLGTFLGEPSHFCSSSFSRGNVRTDEVKENFKYVFKRDVGELMAILVTIC